GLLVKRVDAETLARNGITQRDDLRRLLSTGLLKAFTRAGRAAARVNPALVAQFPRVQSGGSSASFVAAAQSLIAAAREHQAELEPFGVSAELADEATRLLAEYEKTADQASGATSARFLARAELAEVVAGLMDLIGSLDGILRHRFAASPEVLATWRSARVTGGPIGGRKGAPLPNPAAPGANPQAA
ncbi:MAG: hypothetical protein AB7L66_15405, partial [Gemmatimonadales bacterium]